MRPPTAASPPGPTLWRAEVKPQAAPQRLALTAGSMLVNKHAAPRIGVRTGNDPPGIAIQRAAYAFRENECECTVTPFTSR